MNDATLTSNADVAEACGHALRFRLIDHLVVRRWGDELILGSDDPPLWAINLADCKPDNVDERVRCVPSNPSSGRWAQILCGLLSILWRQKRLTIDMLHQVGWYLYLDDRETFKWGLTLDCENEMYSEGYGTLEDLTATAEATVTEFLAFEPLVPTWMAESE